MVFSVESISRVNIHVKLSSNCIMLHFWGAETNFNFQQSTQSLISIFYSQILRESIDFHFEIWVQLNFLEAIGECIFFSIYIYIFYVSLVNRWIIYVKEETRKVAIEVKINVIMNMNMHKPCIGSARSIARSINYALHQTNAKI